MYDKGGITAHSNLGYPRGFANTVPYHRSCVYKKDYGSRKNKTEDISIIIVDTFWVIPSSGGNGRQYSDEVNSMEGNEATGIEAMGKDLTGKEATDKDLSDNDATGEDLTDNEGRSGDLARISNRCEKITTYKGHRKA